VSSPNTPGLRSLQDAGALGDLLAALMGEAAALEAVTVPEEPRGTSGVTEGQGPLPIFVKVAPDLTNGQLDEVLATCVSRGAAGLIATNTTLARDGLAASDASRAAEAGGLSGAPLTVRARQVVERLAARSSLPVIASGGIMTPADAKAMFDAGAELVQLYTGFIYGGPGLAAAINALDTERLGS